MDKFDAQAEAFFAEWRRDFAVSQQAREHAPLWTRVQAHHIPAQLAASTLGVAAAMLLAALYARYQRWSFWPVALALGGVFAGLGAWFSRWTDADLSRQVYGHAYPVLMESSPLAITSILYPILAGFTAVAIVGFVYALRGNQHASRQLQILRETYQPCPTCSGHGLVPR